MGGTAFAASDACDENIASSDLRQSDIVLIGEQHDNVSHHAIQACFVLDLQPAAIVFEMISGQRARSLTPDDRSSEQALHDKLDWENSGWPDFSMYYPIFSAAPEAAIYGAALPRQTVRDAFSDGAVSQFQGDAARFGLDAPLPPAEQAEREEMQFNAHCEAMPREVMGGMVEAQRLRDAELARVTLLALQETGGPVVVILGNGHARSDWGVPVYLRAAMPDLNFVSIGQIEGDPQTDPPYDIAMAGPRMDRGDPCAAFK